MPAVLNKPKELEHLGVALDAFYMLQSSGDFSIEGMSKMYRLCGFFDEKSFMQIMLGLRNALESERHKART